MAGTYVIKKSSNDKFYFNLVAENHEKVLTSEMYNQKQGAENGIDSVKENSAKDDRYEARVSDKGQNYFVLKAGNNEIIGTSEEYSSKSAMEDGIAVVKKLGPAGVVKDES